MNTAYITLNDRRRIWLQPLVWVILGLTYLVIALLFLVFLSNFINDIQVKYAGLEQGPGVTDSVFYPVLFWSSIIGALMMPIFTLRIITEEKIRKQEVLLSSSPIAKYKIIAGKALALLSVILAFAILNLSFPAVIALTASLDWGKILAGVVGLVFFQFSYTCVYIWMATLTHSLMFTLLGSFGFFLLSFVLFFSATSEASTSELFLYLSGFSHMLPPLSGLIASQDLLFYTIGGIAFLCLATIKLRYSEE
jgi:ABC-2 type transport system permease protein